MLAATDVDWAGVERWTTLLGLDVVWAQAQALA
ncbi:hypothetical protein OpiT1DRAFT_01813 [Opitutaceae bacterium TAV1]|nr:hypothetical protein OpiT1DRAFT_01813 [Opitutaceae bacterium TAV1]